MPNFNIYKIGLHKYIMVTKYTYKVILPLLPGAIIIDASLK
jgi:hypothetical protein